MSRAASRWRPRGLLLGWLAVCALVLLAATVVALGGADGLVEAWDSRWDARLARGEELFEAGRYEDAASYLERLDREHPAIFIKHRMDRERERVLELLTRSHMALERKRRSLETAARLVAFDPRNWRNHHLAAEVAAHFGDVDAADKAHAKTLEIYPGHLPSVAGRITLAFEAGRYADVPALYEAYLDAWLVASLAVEVAGAHAELELPVDGMPRRVEAVFEPKGESGGTGARTLALHPAGYAIQLERFELVASPRVGATGPPQVLALPADSAFRPVGMRRSSELPTRWIPTEPGGRLEATGEPAWPTDPERVRLTLAVYKPLPAELWAMIEKSYMNTLDMERLDAARARTVVGAPGAPLQLVD